MPRMRVSRHLSQLFFLLLPALTWSACGGDDDTTATPTGGTSGAAGKSGSAGMAGSSSGKAGDTSTGGKAGKGGTSGAGGTTAGVPNEAGSGGTKPEAGAGGTPSEAGNAGTAGEAGNAGNAGQGSVDKLAEDIDTIVVIYAENRSFDSFFGNFPGAHGLGEVVASNGDPKAAYVAQKDRDGTVLPTLPKAWGGATGPGNTTVIAEAATDGLANAPFPLESGYGTALTTFDVTNDMAHRFFENIMEINGGTNDMFAAWLSAGGLTMGHWDTSGTALYGLAEQYVLADNFFEGAFGGSFLNHQYLICACAPSVPASFVTDNSPSVNVLGAANSKGVPQLATNSSSPDSALDGAPSFKTGNIAPLDYFGDGDGYRAVNTMQPAFQPSGEPPAAGATGGDLAYADATKSDTLPAQTQTTIGDLLSAKGVSWAWYADSWNDAVADGMQDSTAARTVIYAPDTARGAPDFQTHHQPFNFYAAFDPATHAADRTKHLKDYGDLVTAIDGGKLEHVVYFKPTGNFNLHPGYANIDDGDAHIADLVTKLKSGPQWNHMVIVITVDEYGGQWDHVAPPKGDKVGPGTRIPAIIVSPYAKMHSVDHTQYDTASILRLITRRFGVDKLDGLTKRDGALVDNGGSAMGDLTNALDL